MRTTRLGTENGRPRRKRSCIKLKIAVFMPMPMARVSTARKVNPGDLRNCRSAKRMSSNMCGLESVESFVRSTSHHPAVTKLNDTVSVGRVFLRVRHLHDGCALGVEFLKQLHDLFTLTGVEITGGLIRQKQFGVRNDRAGNTDQLLLAAGKLARIQVPLRYGLKSV